MNKIRFSYQYLYTFALIVIVVSLPLSKYLTSIGEFLLVATWLVEGRYRMKLQMARKSSLLLVFLSIYFIHFIWLLFSSDNKYGLHDMQMKLPLLFYPIILATIQPIPPKQKRLILGFFMLALCVSASIGIIVLLGYGKKTVTDAREISVFISHIRLSLMVNMGIYCALWMLMTKEARLFRNENIFCLLILIFLTVFLFLLKSFTGLVVFIVLFAFTIVWTSKGIKLWISRYLLLISTLGILVIIVVYSLSCINRFKKVDRIDFSKLDTKTEAGRYYENDTVSRNTENGHYVWVYVCETELEKAWNSRSSFSFTGRDKKGQRIKFTLIRYLTSRGFRKDSAGVTKLSSRDISLVEDGIANYIYGNKWEMYPYIYRVLWEMNTYTTGENPAGHSVAQRFIYLKIAGDIIKKHFWLGVGTGDVQTEFNKVYEAKYKNIPQHWRRRAHNQLITFWLTFGLIGLVLILFAFSWPIYSRIREGGYLSYIFVLIIILSMLNEDTLETQAGATFIALFYSLFFIMDNKGVDTDREVG